MNMAKGSWYMDSTSAQADQRVLETERVEEHVERDEQRRVGDHQDGQRHQEQEFACPGKSNLAKA